MNDPIVDAPTPKLLEMVTKLAEAVVDAAAQYVVPGDSWMEVHQDTLRVALKICGVSEEDLRRANEPAD